MLVRDFMTANPHILKCSNILQEVVSLFYTYKIDAIPIVGENGQICGLVTRTNLIDTMMRRLPLTATVESIMTKSAIVVHPDNTLEDAWQIPVNHLPVVDDENKIVGILRRQDFMDIFYRRLCKVNSALLQLADLSYGGVIIVNYYGIIRTMNPIAARLIGTTPEESIGKFIYNIIPNTGLMEIIRSGKTERNCLLEAGGQSLLVSRSPIYEGCKVVGAVATIQDISNQEQDPKQQIEVIQQKIEALECLFESLRQGIIVVDTNNVITLANHAYEEIMGIPWEGLLGHSAEQAVENSRMHIVLKTGIPELGEMQTVNGRQVVVNRVPMFKDGEIIGAVGEAIFKDISEVELLLKRGKTFTIPSSSPQVSATGAPLPKLITFESIIGRSRKIIQVKNLAAKVAVSDTTVLIQGESGTGKDLFAQAIHHASSRKTRKLVAINCAAIPAELLEAELFGYDEGAFTGAKKGGKKGKFEIAEGGTLFLDEIGDMPLTMQAKLLRVMQNKTFEHVGGEQVKTCDVRIVAATNKDLHQMVTEKKFREDLYYRLNVVCLDVPALRERQEDIGELVELLMPGICNNLNVPVKRFSPEAMELLRSYYWPGNVRELINILEQIGATINSMLITPKQLPAVVLKKATPDGRLMNGEPAEDECKKIQDVLRDTKGNKALTAKILGIHRSTLYEKLKKYKLK